MSGEEKELLARIGQLAGKHFFRLPLVLGGTHSVKIAPGSHFEGKINRHKNQQAGAVPHTDATPYRRMSLTSIFQCHH